MQSEVLARLKAIIADAEADMAEHFSDSKETGERADLADAEVCLLVDDAKAIVAALSAQVQDVAGWQLVPKEPTPEMLKAVWSLHQSNGGEITRVIYDALLAAAPAKQEG